MLSKYEKVEAWSIFTHDDEPETAAELWKQLGICAIGYWREGPLNELLPSAFSGLIRNQIERFLSIKKGDIIFAYTGDNSIAYYGIVKDGMYQFNRDNEIGREDGFNYPNQYKVTWKETPHHFSRHDFPFQIKSQFGRPGTIHPIRFGRRSRERFLKVIETNAINGSGLSDLDEPIIKEGLKKYLRRNIRSLEPSMRLIYRERGIDRANRPDFMAIDRNGKRVIIECKGVASENAIRQILRYRGAHRNNSTDRNPRLMLIAFKILPECLIDAERNNVELIEVDLSFTRIS